MFKTLVALTALAAAQPMEGPGMATAQGPFRPMAKEEVKKTVHDAVNGTKAIIDTEIRIEKQWWSEFTKTLKLSALRDQYFGYRQLKEGLGMARKQLHYRGPMHGCNVKVFSECVAN